MTSLTIPVASDTDTVSSYGDPALASPDFSTKYEITIPYSTIELDPSDTASTATGSFTKKAVSKDSGRYARIDYPDHFTAPPILEQPGSQPFPIRQPRKFHTRKAKQLLPAPSTHTRQKSFAIGEEWEDFHHRKQGTSSCPTTPISGRKDHRSIYAIDNPNYSRTGGEVITGQSGLSEPARKELEPLPFHYFFSMPTNVSKANEILPNPYNKRNHQFHSTLHCPCFFFFFFICCLPGVHLMQLSDINFKKGRNMEARKYGRLSTVMFVSGSIAGVIFLGIAIYFAAAYVRQFV